MGFMKNAKATSMRKDAQKSWDNDAQYFTPLLNFPTMVFGFSGNVDDWPPMLEAITDVGWKIHTWALVTDKDGKPQAMPLFTR